MFNLLINLILKNQNETRIEMSKHGYKNRLINRPINR